MSFLTAYFNVVEGTQDIPVLCPFNHYTASGLPYKETNPSAHINTAKGVFHCKVCNTGYSVQQFIQAVLGCDYIEASKLSRCFNTAEDQQMWEATCTLTEASRQRALALGISDQVIQELQIKSPMQSPDLIAFPVFMFGHLIDVRKYDPGQTPKIKSRFNCPAGLIIPYDIWRSTPANRTTLICAGEKDMALARSHGFNAITITGGENCLPLALEDFRNKPIAIVYDNDVAGIHGAKRLAYHLLKYTPNVKVVTKFHEVCCEPGEDITDFFTKYRKTRQDLINYLEATPIYVPTEEDKRIKLPVMDLLTATKPEYINHLVQSNIQVVAVSEASYVTAAYSFVKKYRLTGEGDTMGLDETKDWALTDENAQDVLHLVDNNFDEEDIKKNLKILMKVPIKERCVTLTTMAKKTVFKAFVTDMFETNDVAAQPMEFIAYTIDCKLESGKKYLVTHKITPHPYKGQQLTMIIIDAIQADDSVSKFTITEQVKEQLNIIRSLPGSVEERMNLITEKAKGLIGYNGNNTLIQTIDLAYHTALQFDFGTFKNIRGYLDTLIVGESRIGKSSTAETLRKTYGLGTFTSLAGNSATIPGLVGGSNKTANGFQTRAGLIPQNHRGLIIFEEFGKSNANIVTELTDIRSSNEVRIARVSGTVTLPAMVRMISLTNVKAIDGQIRPIASYPNGISIITELVPTAEDIARYDLMLVLADKGATAIDPFWEPQEPFPEEVYRTKVRWVWSRKPEQIIISKEVGLYVLEKANELNRLYECHIKIFGTEAWKKITRLAIAVAGYLVSSSDDYNNLVVIKDHVDYAVAFFKQLYDNPTFKLKEYVDHERQYTQVDADAIAALQNAYDKNPGLILQLEQCAAASRSTLGGATGLSNDELNKALKDLTKGLFIKFSSYDVIPTERFRLAVSKINKNTFARRLGENAPI